MLRILTNLAIVGAALPAAEALLVAPGSPCASNCGNVLDSTSPNDVVCQARDYTDGYNSDAAGVFEGCVQCELESGYATKDNYTDAMAMLYNLRYTVSYCVFNFPQNDHYHGTPCVTSKACGPFADAIQYKNLSSKYDKFDYCDTWPVGDPIDFQGCVQCLQAADDNYLANFVTVLHAGCKQKPEPGVTVAVSGNIFSNDTVEVSTPTPSAKVDPTWFDNGPLTLSAKKKRRAFLKNLEVQYASAKNGGWPSPQPPHRETGETPLSQRPLRGWDDSPMTMTTEKNFPRYFSPYSSQYNSPVSALEGQQMAWPEPALGSPREIGIALADQQSHGGWLQSPLSPDDKGKMKDESYEMQNVYSAGGHTNNNAEPDVGPVQAPLLGHPGYGRGTDSPPRQYEAN
ncbi:hypothetical protein PT974_06763 [Cladobotryum mycophilum]|uniref:Uncharacterized protein n=1 Tax=Cladobotryum mycophilum TaxID=491253 RepID=A0ABR0SMP0_9HYPO